MAEPAGAVTTTSTAIPMVYGPPPSGGDDTAAIQAALPTAGILRLPPGNFLISGVITVNTGQDLQGAGGGIGLSATVLTCTAVGAGVVISGAGGITSGFRVDGNNVATTPFTRNGGAGQWVGRTFEDITVVRSAQDGITCLGAQNDAWYKVASQSHARDCWVLDQGYGGALFSRCEISGGSRYNLRLDTQVLGGPWTCPMDVVFHQCIVEQTQAGSVSVAYLHGASSIKFDHVAFYASLPLTGPMVDVNNACAGITFCDTTVQHTTSVLGGNGVSVDSGSQVVFTGMCYFQNLTNAVYIKVGTPSVDVKGMIYLTNVTNRYGADAGQNIQSYIANNQNDVIVSQRQNPTDYAYVSTKPGGGGYYTFETSSGRKVWGDGTNYLGDVGLQRRAAGVLAVDTKNLFATGYGTTATRQTPTTDMIGAIRFNTDSKQLEVSDGGLWYGPGMHATGIYASGTFVVPPGVKVMRCRALGGGGGGGGGGNIGALSLATACHGGPGGGAGMVVESQIAVTPGDTLTILIGAGGTGGAGAAVSSATTGNNGTIGTAGGMTTVTDGTGKLLIAARGGGAGPGGPGSSISGPVQPSGAGAYGCNAVSYWVSAPGCGSFANYNSMPTYNGVSGGASGSFAVPANGGGSGWTAGLWGQPAYADACTSPTANGITGASAVVAGCGGNGGAAGGKSGTGGAGGAGAPGAIEFWWVS